jgi:tetratricopeptide (TPR) repeat protein
MLNQAGTDYKYEYSFIVLGDAYKALGETQKAEEQYQLAANMVPYKFYPLYLLAKLYNETGHHKKALALALQILNKKIKVPSQAIEEIREEMRKLIFQNTQIDNTLHNKMKGENYMNDTQMAFKHQFW